ncbi:MAG TPA: 50S ribosomal protein L6, partial [Candidatus Moranbacteria bacterium]|nr:50S ribosomal protein L6 [Candidatus Moranbacteria bacterium]
MSRIGKKIIAIPSGVTVEVKDNIVTAKGAKGTLSFEHRNEVAVVISTESIVIEKKGKTKETPAIWGTTSRMVENLLIGVSQNFEKKLELNGVGFRMSVTGKNVNLALGFSHPVVVPIVEGIDVKIEGNVMTISGIDKYKVGQFAANIKKLKPVEPYKGKGFKY